MAIPYARLVAGISLRLNALVGTTPAALETTYLKTGSFTQANFDSGDWTWTVAKDLVLLAVGKYAQVIGNVGNHPWRRSIHGVTASIAHGGIIPATDSSSNGIVGIYGSVKDATDGEVCTEAALESIRRRVRNANSYYKTPVYNFKIDGTRVYHTRTGVTIDVCVFNRATEKAAIDADGNCPLPEAVEGGLICEGVSMAFKDDAYVTQAAQYKDYSNDQIRLIQQGLTSAPSKSIPTPARAAV